MRILIVGGGGREHALAWRLAQSPQITALFASPGNPGIAKLAWQPSGAWSADEPAVYQRGKDSRRASNRQAPRRALPGDYSIAQCVPAPTNIADYADLAEHLKIDLTVVGPEAPLVAGIVDEFRVRRLKIVGPTQAAARLEGSKLFAKAFFAHAGIPTARTGSSINEFSFPLVIKADGLAAGKGVVIAHDRTEADRALKQLGSNVVIEEFLQGEEVSFIGLVSGRDVIPFQPTQDHKRLLDGDRGPNTGGMGAYLDGRILSSNQIGEIMDRIMIPAVSQMAKDGAPFTGFLYAGLMMTADGPKVLEFNVRLGDPETQVLMHSFEGDLVGLLQGEATTYTAQQTKPTVCVVLASHGYPEAYPTGQLIFGIEAAEAAGATVFHAGTAVTDGQLQTKGGRVLGVTAAGDTLPQAISKAYQAVEKIYFDGVEYRTDIGQKGLRRW